MQIAERTARWRRERRVLLRVSRAVWRLDGRDTIADRLLDEAGWLRQCADWLMTTRQRSTCVRAAIT